MARFFIESHGLSPPLTILLLLEMRWDSNPEKSRIREVAGWRWSAGKAIAGRRGSCEVTRLDASPVEQGEAAHEEREPSLSACVFRRKAVTRFLDDGFSPVRRCRSGRRPETPESWRNRADVGCPARLGPPAESEMRGDQLRR